MQLHAASDIPMSLLTSAVSSETGLPASSLANGGSAGAGGGMTSAPVTVSPNIQTAISPQISPNFVQTGAGSTGAVTAGTYMSAGTTQGAATGQRPGVPAPYSDIGMPMAAPLPTDYGYSPNVVTTGGFMQYMPYVVGVVALIGLFSFLKSRPSKA